MIPFFMPNVRQPLRRTLRELVKDAGLLSSMQLCLDPGDRNSWPGNGQTFLDVSGYGRDFTLGASASAGGDDPTFNGRLGGEGDDCYFSSDGNDGFLKASANDTFFNSLHAPGFLWTLCTFEFFTNSYGAGINTRTGAISNSKSVGVSTYIVGTNLGISIGNGSAVEGGSVGSSNVVGPNKMLMLGWTAKHNSATSREYGQYVNGAYESAFGQLGSLSPSSGAATQARFGLSTDGSLPMGSGRRLYGLLMFNKMLSQSEFDALRTSCLRRWPTI